MWNDSIEINGEMNLMQSMQNNTLPVANWASMKFCWNHGTLACDGIKLKIIFKIYILSIESKTNENLWIIQANGTIQMHD